MVFASNGEPQIYIWNSAVQVYDESSIVALDVAKVFYQLGLF